MEEKKIVDMLTQDSVSILTQRYVDVDGVIQKVGESHRKAYVNSNVGRQELEEEQPTDVVNSVISIWGDNPTIEEREDE